MTGNSGFTTMCCPAKQNKPRQRFRLYRGFPVACKIDTSHFAQEQYTTIGSWFQYLIWGMRERAGGTVVEAE